MLSDHVLETVVIAVIRNAAWDVRSSARERWDNIKIHIQNDVKSFQGKKKCLDKKLIENLEASLAHLHQMHSQCTCLEQEAEFSSQFLQKQQELSKTTKSS